MQIGFTQTQIGQMYYGKWALLFEQYKKQWNMRQDRMVYAEKPKKTSVLDL